MWDVTGSAEAINFPRLNLSPTRSLRRTYTPEPRGIRGRRNLPIEPWTHLAITDSRLRRDQLVALGRAFIIHPPHNHFT